MTLYSLAKPLLFRIPPETAHRAAATGLHTLQGTALESLCRRHYCVDDDRLTVSAFGHEFPNPVGLAAGFDKYGTMPRALASLGFGHIEVGGVTPDAQMGNPRPRLFRLPADQALINRLGLNNPGATTVGRRLNDTAVPVPVSVNLAKNEQTPSEVAAEDYRQAYERLDGAGDLFVVNVSCPNSQGFEALQSRDRLHEIFTALETVGAAPVLVKLSPDLPEPAVEDALSLVREFELAGVIATNTTTDRPEGLSSPHQSERGGLSGRPLAPAATEMVRFVAERVDVPVVGVGGVFTAEDAYRKIRAGAQLVQLYTGLVYRGPSIARAINQGLVELLERDGFGSVDEAVGADV